MSASHRPPTPPRLLHYNDSRNPPRFAFLLGVIAIHPRNPTTIAQLPSFAGVRALVVGLGRFGGGVGVTRWLAGQGATVTVTDQAAPDSLADSLAEVADLPLTLCLGGHDQCDLAATDLVVLNPAVQKSKSPLFREILRRDIPWTTEINLFCERCPAPVLAITGSFGKSTTCAMLAHVLEQVRDDLSAGYRTVHLGGNIGRSLLNDLSEIDPRDIVVLEMSNAQLEDINRIHWEPAIAAITNLVPHHLDRYDDFEGYAQSKLNLIRAGSGTCPVVFGQLDPRVQVWLGEAVGKRRDRLRPIPEIDPIALRVPGRHNQINAACVMTIGRAMGLDSARIRDALGSFCGLPHRLEFVAEAGGVRYINDSKSTAPNATIIAIRALADESGSLVVIVGGQNKNVDFSECAECLARSARVVICCGESGPAFARAMGNAAGDSGVTHVVHGVAEAVATAARLARPGDTVLFSPGAPSFDHYLNYTKRGDDFRRHVLAL